MLSIPIEADKAISTSPNYNHPITSSAHDLTLFNRPRMGVGLDKLIEDVLDTHQKAEFYNYKSGIASFLLIAHSLGVVSEQEINESIEAGWKAVFKLYRESLVRTELKLNHESMNIAGSRENHNDFGSLYSTLRRADDGFFLHLTSCLRFADFDLLKIDVTVSSLVFSCLYWVIRELGFGVFSFDVISYSIFLDDELGAFNELRTDYPDKSFSQLAELILDSGNLYPFCEIYDESTKKETIVERLVFLQSINDDKFDCYFGDRLDIQKIREILIHWRLSGNEHYKNPWVRFIRKVITTWKWAMKNSLKERSVDLKIDDVYEEDNETLFDFAYVIGVGFSWESEVVDSHFQYIHEGGEDPTEKIKLTPARANDIALKLIGYAKARGLLRLAELTSLTEDKNEYE